MALTSKKISVKNIIAKAYNDLDITEEFDIGLLIEWSAEALGKINVYSQLESKYECIDICNYKAEIPCDLVYLNEVGYKGYQLDKAFANSINQRDSNKHFYYTPTSVNQYKIENIAFFLGQTYTFPNNDSFIMENGWFKTSFKEGTLDIKYDAMPLDEEGYPLVPDHESFRDALFWYIAYKYFYRKAIKEDKFRWFYQDAEQKYRYYVGQAGAEGMMPDEFTLENIKRNYLRMVPKINDYKNFYRNLNGSR